MVACENSAAAIMAPSTSASSSASSVLLCCCSSSNSFSPESASSHSRNFEMRRMDTMKRATLDIETGIMTNGICIMSSSVRVGNTMVGVSSCPPAWYSTKTTATTAAGIAFVRNATATYRSCDVRSAASSTRRFSSMLRMNDGSHDMNFATRTPEKNSLVALSRASVARESVANTAKYRRIRYPCSGMKRISTPKPAKAHQPTRRYSSTSATTSCNGAPMATGSSCGRLRALSMSLLIMLTIRPTLISGCASAVREMVAHFSKRTPCSAFWNM
ncbi:hypothetical protein DQ04_13861010 [Trypanosoma grayi]|uniref:hypothetical protein n=1 Tax=Trypanosoma grayi TaxID=71804 RepID=UPI0004F481E9|nr:hypothetical protein DQ04_13861010 [Trypanosoma grayi]KEG06451.1 hypothetical protein DQ04_13861010 [Trypanosoma grayi]